MPRRGMLLVISSPSGAGKSSLSRRLLDGAERLVLSVSATTRPARRGEVDGREYWFVSPDRFQAMIAEDEFLEWAEVHEHAYGSPRRPVMAHLEAGRDVLFDIDWQGAQSIAAAEPEDTVRVFILPPSLSDLAKRLRGRAQDAEAVIERRLGRAVSEIDHWPEYDYVLINDDFEETSTRLAAIYLAESLKRRRNLWIEPMVAAMVAEGEGKPRFDRQL
jgi:guanylate kinase